MLVEVRYHGIIADMLRRKRETVELPDGATVADLLAILAADAKAVPVLKQTRPFVDGRQADRADLLRDGAEVVLMRPISGGLGSGD